MNRSRWWRGYRGIQVFGLGLLVLMGVQQFATGGDDRLKYFLKDQTAEIKAAEHAHKLELQELKSTQAAKWRAFEKDEKTARYQYFETHDRGPDRRAYVKDFIERRQNLKKQMAEQKAFQNSEYEKHLKQLKADQQQKLIQFKESLKK
jgi:hypothetical protein